MKYPHLLEPLRIGNTILKNRMLASYCLPDFMQGPEPYPSENYNAFFANFARNGAGIVDACRWDEYPNQRNGDLKSSHTHMPAFDLTNPATLNYVSELAEEVHLYGSKILINLGPSTVLMKGRMQSVEDLRALGKDGLWLPEDATEEEIEALLDKYVEQVQLYVDCGFDGVSDRIDACLCPFGSDGSAERGKSVEYRTRFELLAFRRLKEVFGPSFIIEGVMSGAMPYGYTGNSNVGYSLAEFIEFCKLADYDYFEKIAEGRGEDIRPCIWCNNCHGPSFDDGRHGPWVNRCSVNPEMGFEAQLGRLIREPGPAKKVAVIGGGPAGLQAAITAAERGHSVTLYEATGYLGGQLFHAESFAFKWPLRDFKNWQVRQAEKLGVEILLNTKATPALIQAGGYDAVIAAIGAKPVFPKNIAGLRDENGNVKYPHAHDVFGREADLGKRVVIVGGSETGIETALYLLENGHDVTIVTRRERIGIDCSKAHYITKSWMDTRRGDGRADEAPEWAKYDNLITIPNATTTRVEGNRVFYTDADGTEQSVSGDSVVINGGVAPLQEEALGFYGIANKFVVIGDANGVGNLQKCIREGWSRACEI